MKIKTIVSTILLLASLKAAQAQTTLADWTFDNAGITAPVLNPAASSGIYSSVAIAESAGMTNSLTPTPSIGAPDVIANPAVNSDSTPALPDAWRVRAKGSSPNTGNGWSDAAAVGTQGAQFAVPTTGYANIQLTFDITATAQGEGLAQVEYTTDGVTWNNAVLTYAPNPALVLNNTTTFTSTNGLVIGSYFNMVETGTYTQVWYTNVTANLSGIPAVNNNSLFAVRIVNAAKGTNCIAASNVALNNTSGNWSLDNIQITGTTYIAPIAQWNFENLTITNYSPNPAPSINNTVGGVSVVALGMNIYPTPSIGTNDPDVLLGVTGDTGSDGITNYSQIWRVRGQLGSSANGWSSLAPIGTQGAQFNTDTTGYTNVVVSFDWYLTSQGEGNLQFEYTTDGSTWSNAPIAIPAAQAGTYIQFVDNTSDADANSIQGYYVNCLSSALKQEWFTNLTVTITNPLAANNPNFGIRLVNASTGASCVNATGGSLNNSSGNWRFDNINIVGQAVLGGSTLLTPPTIAASISATVDGPFTNTFLDNAAWRAAITNITVNGTMLSSSAYSISAGQIVYTPSASTLLQSYGTKAIVVQATNYLSDSVSQSIQPGAPKVLSVTSQPVSPTGDGGTFVTQPSISIVDQYGNPATNLNGSITATVNAGSWSFGPFSGTSIAVVSGSGVFTNLSATNASAVTGATMTFTVSGSGLGGLPSTATNSATFNLPAPSGSFHAGDLAVEQEDLATKNSTFSIIEVNPTSANQSAPVNVFPVPATGTNGLRQASSASTGRLADSDDGTLVCFSAAQSEDSSVSDATTVDPRGAGTFNYLGQYTLQATYVGLGDGTANQARSAITIDDTNFYMGDKGGVYVNGDVGGNAYIGFTAGNGANVRSIKSYGGTPYAMQQAGGTDPAASVLQFLPLPNGTPNIPGSPGAGNQSLFPLEGFSTNLTVNDFYLLNSGNNTNIYDYCYYIDGTNTTSGAIYKLYYTGALDGVSGEQIWAYTGNCFNTPNGGDGLCARTNVNGGVDLFYTTGNGGSAGNSVVMVHDSATWNQPINITSSTVLYTVGSQSTLKGIAFAPVNPNAVVAVTPILITPGSVHFISSGPGTGSFTLSFNNTSGTSTHFNILATTNIALPLNQWQVLGNPTEGSPGSYSFTDTSATNANEYYRIQFNP